METNHDASVKVNIKTSGARLHKIKQYKLNSERVARCRVAPGAIVQTTKNYTVHFINALEFTSKQRQQRRRSVQRVLDIVL